MGIIDGDLGGYRPICNECGVALCFEISDVEYEARSLFWDDWVCDRCGPSYVPNWHRAMRTEHSEEYESIRAFVSPW